MKRHLRLFNPLQTMGLLGKMYVYTPKGTLTLTRSSVTLEYPNNKDAVVTGLAQWVVAKHNLWHLCHRN